MREYSKISPQIWIGETGRELRKAGPEAQIVAFYLLTSPHANWLGLYYMPLTYISYETGLPFEGASKGLRRAIEAGFCSYDSPSEMVFVHEMASYQIGDHLEPNDNRCKAIQKEYNELPENPFLPKFYERYSKSFNISEKRDFKVKKQRGLKGASKPLRSQESESESESESEMESEPLGPPSEAQSPEVKQERKRDLIWDALADRFYQPTTKQSKSEFAGVVKELKAINCKPEEISIRADRIERTWGKDKLTIHSLAKHWDKFSEDMPSGLNGSRASPVQQKLSGLQEHLNELRKEMKNGKGSIIDISMDAPGI